MTTDKNLSAYVASVLRAARADQKMTQAAVAKKSGLSQPTVSRILDNKRELKLEELAMVCDGLSIRLEDVLAEARRLSRANGDTLTRIITK